VSEPSYGLPPASGAPANHEFDTTHVDAAEVARLIADKHRLL
jgi:hypothetical protein